MNLEFLLQSSSKLHVNASYWFSLGSTVRSTHILTIEIITDTVAIAKYTLLYRLDFVGISIGNGEGDREKLAINVDGADGNGVGVATKPLTTNDKNIRDYRTQIISRKIIENISIISIIIVISPFLVIPPIPPILPNSTDTTKVPIALNWYDSSTIPANAASCLQCRTTSRSHQIYFDVTHVDGCTYEYRFHLPHGFAHRHLFFVIMKGWENRAGPYSVHRTTGS